MTFLTIENPIRWLFLAHALAGALALIVLIAPWVSKKGSKLHVNSGWIYTVAMIFVVLSTFVLTSWRLFADPAKTPESKSFSIFLFYIAVFTMSAIAFGLRALKNKQRNSPSRTIRHIGPPIATIFVGLATQIVGLKHENLLLIVFPFFGHLTAKSQLQYWLKTPEDKMHWWFAHLNGMMVASIATITAFIVTAVPRIWPGPIAESPLLWMAPGIILGVIVNSYFVKTGMPSNISPKKK